MHRHLLVIYNAERVGGDHAMPGFVFPFIGSELNAGNAGDAEMAEFAFVHIECLEDIVSGIGIEWFYPAMADRIAVGGVIVEQDDLSFFAFSLFE